jgi:myo-inositol 2-dehydrogenase/D-chiro-inositol 1-dehydrogenase
VPVFLDFNRRFDPHHAALEQAVRTGEAGVVELVSITSRDPEPPPLGYLENSPGALFLETTSTWRAGCSRRSRSRSSPWRAA